MAQPWQVVAQAATAEGPLQLRRRGARDFLIVIGNQILMNSLSNRSEVVLGQLGCAALRAHPRPRVLVGGLGMGFTLRAVLDTLPATAEVVVAELNPVVVEWCRGPLAELTAGAVLDPRVTVAVGDVAALIARHAAGAGRFDAIVLDLYRGPHAKTDPRRDPLYGSRALADARAALNFGGVLAVWGENYDDGYVRRMQTAGFVVTVNRPGRGGLRHAVFLGQLPGAPARS